MRRLVLDEPWRYGRHVSFPPSAHLHVVCILLCAQRTMPHISLEVWLEVLHHVKRGEFMHFENNTLKAL